MGASLTAEAMIYALPRLAPNRDDRARVVLLAMCNRALDQGAGRNLYFAGSSNLAQLLGFLPNDPAGARAVERAMARLVEAGLIAQIGRTSARGKRQWAIQIGPEEGKQRRVTPTEGNDDEQ